MLSKVLRNVYLRGAFFFFLAIIRGVWRSGFPDRSQAHALTTVKRELPTSECEEIQLMPGTYCLKERLESQCLPSMAAVEARAKPGAAADWPQFEVIRIIWCYGSRSVVENLISEILILIEIS